MQYSTRNEMAVLNVLQGIQGSIRIPDEWNEAACGGPGLGVAGVQATASRIDQSRTELVSTRFLLRGIGRRVTDSVVVLTESD